VSVARNILRIGIVVAFLCPSCAAHHSAPKPTIGIPTPLTPSGLPTLTPSPRPTPTVYAYRRCDASDLRAAQDFVSAASQQETLAIDLTNVSATACYMDGYPRISAYDAGGRQLPFVISHHGDEMVTSRPPHRVAVGVGGTVAVLVNKQNCVNDGNGDDRVASMHLSPPGGAGVITISHFARFWQYCREPDRGRTVTVSPVEANEKDGFAAT
jgi:hypothetical protein